MEIPKSGLWNKICCYILTSISILLLSSNVQHSFSCCCWFCPLPFTLSMNVALNGILLYLTLWQPGIWFSSDSDSFIHFELCLCLRNHLVSARFSSIWTTKYFLVLGMLVWISCLSLLQVLSSSIGLYMLWINLSRKLICVNITSWVLLILLTSLIYLISFSLNVICF